MASIMGIEAQQAAVLLAVQALLTRRCSAIDHTDAYQRGLTAGRGGQCRLPQRLLFDQFSRPRQPRSRQVRIRRNQIAASEAEILEMTEDLERMHHDQGVPALQTSMAEWHDQIRSGTSKPTSRRTFLLGVGGAVAGAGVLAAVGATPGLAAAATSASVTPATSGNAGSGAHRRPGCGRLWPPAWRTWPSTPTQNAISAATAGKLGTVPPAVVTLAQTALSQHTSHAAAWNSLLTGSGKKAVTVTDPKLTPTVQTAFGKVTNVTQLGELALMLENIAAQTYQAEASMLKSKKAIQVASTIAPVEMQHERFCTSCWGMYPWGPDDVRDSTRFSPTSMAA